MKRLSFVAIAVLALAVACNKKSGSGDPVTPTPVVVTSTQTFTVPLVAAAEVPAISNAESTAAGSATIKFNLTKTDGVLTAATADFTVALSGFPAGSTVTIAHIHPGAAGTTGGILVNTTLVSGETTLTNGSGTFTKNNIAMTPDIAQGIINAPANFYFNVHSQMNSGGVIRGQMNGVTGIPASGGGGGGSTDPVTPPPGNGYVDPTI